MPKKKEPKGIQCHIFYDEALSEFTHKDVFNHVCIDNLGDALSIWRGNADMHRQLDDVLKLRIPDGMDAADFFERMGDAGISVETKEGGFVENLYQCWADENPKLADKHGELPAFIDAHDIVLSGENGSPDAIAEEIRKGDYLKLADGFVFLELKSMDLKDTIFCIYHVDDFKPGINVKSELEIYAFELPITAVLHKNEDEYIEIDTDPYHFDAEKYIADAINAVKAKYGDEDVEKLRDILNQNDVLQSIGASA